MRIYTQYDAELLVQICKLPPPRLKQSLRIRTPGFPRLEFVCPVILALAH